MSDFDDFGSQLGDDADSVWLNDLFERTRLPGTAEELSSEAVLVGAMVRTIAQPVLVSDISARRRLRISKTAARAAIAAAVVFVGTSTAAATGNLPDPAQSAVSRASSHLGVDIPDPYDERAAGERSGAATTVDPSTTSTVLDDHSVTVPVSEVPSTNAATFSTSPGLNPNAPESTDLSALQPVTPETTGGQGPDANGPAKHGLCRAWAAHRSDSPANQNSTAMRNLQAAAAAAGQTVEEFCADVLGTEPGPAEVATTSPAPPPGPPVEGDGTKEKDKKEPGQGNNGPPADKEKRRSPQRAATNGLVLSLVNYNLSHQPAERLYSTRSQCL